MPGGIRNQVNPVNLMKCESSINDHGRNNELMQTQIQSIDTINSGLQKVSLVGNPNFTPQKALLHYQMQQRLINGSEINFPVSSP